MLAIYRYKLYCFLYRYNFQSSLKPFWYQFFSFIFFIQSYRSFCLRCHNSWKSDNSMGSNKEKPWTNLQNLYKNWSKEFKRNNFCYCKVGRAITEWGAIKKSQVQYCYCTINIFANCIKILLLISLLNIFWFCLLVYCS